MIAIKSTQKSGRAFCILIQRTAWFSLALVSMAQAQVPAQQVFERYVTAAHAGDMAAIRTLIADEVERSDFPACTPVMNNKDCLVHYIEAAVVGQHGQLKIIGTELRGDTVHARLELRSDLTRKAGVERALGTDIVQVRNGLITAFRFVPDFADEQTAMFFGTLGIGPRAARP